LFCFISYFAIILDGVHLSRRATSATGTDSASLLFFIIFLLLHSVWIKMYIKCWTGKWRTGKCRITSSHYVPLIYSA